MIFCSNESSRVTKFISSLLLDHNVLGNFVDADTLMMTQVEVLNQCYKCKICGQKIKKKGHMKRHFNDVHLKAWKYRCPCDRWYNNKSSLYHHMAKYHRDLTKGPKGGVVNLDEFLVQ